MWRCLENIRGLVGVPALWRSWLGGDFGAFRGAFLRQRPERAESYPCPNVCGCAHEVVRHDDGRIVGVCQCEPWNCNDVPLKEEELVLWELNWSRFGRAIATAFGCDPRESALGVPGVMQAGSFGGAAMPLLLSIQHEPEEFRRALTESAVRLREGFVVLSPTSKFFDARAKELAANAKAGLFDLESNLTLMASGLLVAAKPGVELFRGLLAEPEEEMGDEELRRIYGQVLLTSRDQGGAREAPLKTVFDFYCVKGFSAREVSVKLDCSKATVMNRLATLHEIAGVPPKELRAYKPFFEQMEKDLTEPRARRVRRKDAAYGNDSPDADE